MSKIHFINEVRIRAIQKHIKAARCLASEICNDPGRGTHCDTCPLYDDCDICIAAKLEELATSAKQLIRRKVWKKQEKQACKG